MPEAKVQHGLTARPKWLSRLPLTTGAVSAVGAGAAVLSVSGPVWLAIGAAAGGALLGAALTNEIPRDD